MKTVETLIEALLEAEDAISKLSHTAEVVRHIQLECGGGEGEVKALLKAGMPLA